MFLRGVRLLSGLGLLSGFARNAGADPGASFQDSQIARDSMTTDVEHPAKLAGVYLSGRTIPVPKSISPRAQAVSAPAS
jgi:hypothetical protein